MQRGGTHGGGRFIVSGDEMRDEKNKNREGDGASDFDGFCSIVGHNNQPKSGRIIGICLGEVARRAITIGEDAVASIRPSDYEAKK